MVLVAVLLHCSCYLLSTTLGSTLSWLWLQMKIQALDLHAMVSAARRRRLLSNGCTTSLFPSSKRDGLRLQIWYAYREFALINKWRPHFNWSTVNLASRSHASFTPVNRNRSRLGSRRRSGKCEGKHSFRSSHIGPRGCSWSMCCPLGLSLIGLCSQASNIQMSILPMM